MLTRIGPQSLGAKAASERLTNEWLSAIGKEHVPQRQARPHGLMRLVTTATATTVRPAATIAAPRPAAARAILARFCFVDGQRAPADLLTVHCLDCILRFVLAAHLHK